MAEKKKFKIPTAEEMEISSSPKINAHDTYAIYRRQQKEEAEKETESKISEKPMKQTLVAKSSSVSKTYPEVGSSHSVQKEKVTSIKTSTVNLKPVDSKSSGVGEPKPSSSCGSSTGRLAEIDKGPEVPENLPVKGGKTNSVIVNPRQRGNPIIKFIRNVPWEYGDIVPDYLMGQTTCALFLSLRYHQLHPDYIHNRLKQLGRSYELRIMLVQVDVKEPHHLLKELSKICILADCTLILAFSTEEAGRYLETYKVYENKPPDAIMEKTDQDFMSKMTECLTNVKSVNKTDAMTLMSTFGTLENIMKASAEDLSLCPGFGPQKAKRLHDTFQEPFLKANKKMKSNE